MITLKEEWHRKTKKKKTCIKEDKENQRKTQKKNRNSERQSGWSAKDEVQFNFGNDIEDGYFAKKKINRWGIWNRQPTNPSRNISGDYWSWKPNLFPSLEPNRSITLEVTETGIASFESTSQTQ